jgi:hypothetical protein
MAWRTGLALFVLLTSLLLAASAVVRGAGQDDYLEKVTPAWDIAGGWALLGSAADADGRRVALIRGTDHVTQPVEGWQTRNLFRWESGGAVDLLYGPDAGTQGDPISRMGCAIGGDGSRIIFGTYRQAYPQGQDLRLWTEGQGERVIFASARNADLDFATISADGTTVAVVEITPPALQDRVFIQRIYRWRENTGAQLVIERRGYTYVQGMALSADGRRLAYTWRGETTDPFTRGELHLVDESGTDRTLWRLIARNEWGPIGIAADGRTIVAQLPGDPFELGGPGLNGPGIYVWREGDAPARLDPELPTYRQGAAVMSSDATRIEWARQESPSEGLVLEEWTPADGRSYVFGPGGTSMSDARLTADGDHWTIWLETGPEGRGLYRVTRGYPTVPTPTATTPATIEPSPTPTPTAVASPTPTPTPVLPPRTLIWLPAVARNSLTRGVGGGLLRAEPGQTSFAMHLGGLSDDGAYAVAIGADGSTYIAGRTYSSDLPTTPGAYQTTNAGGYDAFVARDDANHDTVYVTYIGGTGYDAAYGIAVDATGAAYVTGHTTSLDFPTTASAYQKVLHGGTDAFVAKLDPTGAVLEYGTYLGGGTAAPGTNYDASGYDFGRAIAVNGQGEANVAGSTTGDGFPTTPGVAYEQRPAGSHTVDAFVSQLDSTGSALKFSTYLVFTDRFGPKTGEAFGLALDSAGAVYVAGDAGTGSDAFAVKLTGDGRQVVYSTHLGCCAEYAPGVFLDPGIDHAAAIAVGADDSAYVTGYAIGSSISPTTPGAFQPGLAGLRDGFVAKLDPTGALGYLTYLGGGRDDVGNGIAVDGAGDAYVTGTTYSGDFPTGPVGPFPNLGEGCDLCGNPFAAVLGPDGSALQYGGMFGGRLEDRGYGIAANGSRSMVITGLTFSPRVIDVSPPKPPPAPSSPRLYPDAFLAQLEWEE